MDKYSSARKEYENKAIIRNAKKQAVWLQLIAAVEKALDEGINPRDIEIMVLDRVRPFD